MSHALGWILRYVHLFRPRLRDQPSEMDTLPTHNAATAPSAGDAERRTEAIGLLHLLHCNSTGVYGVKLYQDVICESLNDRELFKFLRTVYCRARKETKWFTLRTMTNISLCKVCSYSWL